MPKAKVRKRSHGQYIKPHPHRVKPMHKLSQQEEYIRRITEPRTPDDLILALQNPYTIVYKNMMNLILLGMMIDEIAKELIIKYLNTIYLASEKEKEEIFKAISKEKEFSMMQPMKQTQIHNDSLFPDFKAYDGDKLNSLYLKYESNIETLSQQANNLDRLLVELDRQDLDIINEWRETTRERVETLTHDLLAEESAENRQIHILVPNTESEFRSIEPDSEKAQKILAATIARPEPKQFVRVISQAFAPEEVETRFKQLDTWSGILSVIRFGGLTSGADAEAVIGPSILEAINKNKAIVQKLSELNPNLTNVYQKQLENNTARDGITISRNGVMVQLDQETQLRNKCANQLRKISWVQSEDGSYKPIAHDGKEAHHRSGSKPKL